MAKKKAAEVEEAPASTAIVEMQLTPEGAKLAAVRTMAQSYIERATAMGSSHEHPESARLGALSGTVLDLANRLEQAWAAAGVPLEVPVEVPVESES